MYRPGTGKCRCSQCCYDFTPHRLPLYLARDKRKAIITRFILEQSNQIIADMTGIDRKRVVRALTWKRRVVVEAVLEAFSGNVEMDETCVGGHWKNEPASIPDQGTRRGGETKLQPVFDVPCRNGLAWTEIVGDADAATLRPLVSRGCRRNRSSAPRIGRRKRSMHLKYLAIGRRIIVIRRIVTAREIISMGCKEPGDICRESPRRSEEFVVIQSIRTWVNTSGDGITKRRATECNRSASSSCWRKGSAASPLLYPKN